MAPGKVPRFTQKPSIKQTPEGHLLMECSIESSPSPQTNWFHGTTPINAGGRYTITLDHKAGDMYIATLLITVRIIDNTTDNSKTN